MTKLSVSQAFSFLLLTTCAAFEGESECENSCPSRERVSLIRMCHCDSACAVVYNDCCYDSPYKLTRPPDNIPEWQCSFVPGEKRHFFVTGKCQNGWDGDRKVIQKCETLSSSVIKDPQGQVPVTSRTTEKTYKNYYCAVCNEDMDDIISWQIKAHCDNAVITSEDVQNNMKFNNIRQRWGVYKKESLSGRSTFYECQIIYHRPINVSKESVRECVPGLISSCPPSWRDLTIKRKCESYLNPVFWNRRESYRNIYCAVCNHQKRDDYWCRPDTDPRPNIFNVHFGHLIKGNTFGNTSACKENEWYDSFKNECRQFVYCRKGQIVKNGKCVRSI